MRREALEVQAQETADEMRELQRKLVEGMAAASAERMETTNRGLEDAGTSEKPSEGEEVDWYCCANG